jgi:hypothetical protein
MLHHKLWFRVTRRQKQQICGSTSGAVHRARPRAASRAAGKWTWRILPQYPLSRPWAHLYGLYEQPACAKSGITGVMPQRVVREGHKAQEVLDLIEDERRASHRGSVSGGRASVLAFNDKA